MIEEIETYNPRRQHGTGTYGPFAQENEANHEGGNILHEVRIAGDDSRCHGDTICTVLQL